jgi:hypothetical protein
MLSGIPSSAQTERTRKVYLGAGGGGIGERVTLSVKIMTFVFGTSLSAIGFGFFR